jgi:para-aminobenzoate synthetase/4-amino-4-deoxychorismate lyase
MWKDDEMPSPTLLGDVVFASREGNRCFSNPMDVLVARELTQVIPCLERAEAAVRDGCHAAGFLAYEAAPAFDPALSAHLPGPVPLAWFALYDSLRKGGAPVPDGASFEVGPWRPAITRATYNDNVGAIRERIAAGETYQVNYTFPLRATFAGDAYSWFEHLRLAQTTDYAAFLDLGRFCILSVSPELFFHLEGANLRTCPMKGTRPRGPGNEEDRRMQAELASSTKERAENVMIVDLLRNDMGRISQTGSVRVERLFAIERYDTVWQMTSTIVSNTGASIVDIFRALFPCGSVTGAPKVQTTQVIKMLEPFPRAVYCGAIGWMAPGRRAQFSVAIRTVTVDRHEQRAVYHVGGGITYDSAPQSEYEECLAKAAVLDHPAAQFELLESILHDEDGYFLLDEHLERLAASASYFSFKIDLSAISASLQTHSVGFGPVRLKIRVLLRRDGQFRIESSAFPLAEPVQLGFAREPIDDRSPFVFHKTTRREIYERARASRPDCGDVLLWNDRGEITESTTANVVLRIGGRWLTPPVDSGLLAGTLRNHLLAKGIIQEAVLNKADVQKAEAIGLINSVRKWIDVRWVPDPA